MELAGRYSLVPNCIGYCGTPDFAKVFANYRARKVTSVKVKKEIRGFIAEYAYLKTIAKANRITDPFHPKVLESFWLGNSLLKNVKRKDVEQMIRKDFIAMGKMNSVRAEKKIAALPSHPYIHHDFNTLFLNFVGDKVPRTLKNFDNCRIAYGRVLAVGEKTAKVRYRPLIRKGKGFGSGKPKTKMFKRYCHGLLLELDLKVGDTVTLHWGTIIQKIRK
jgi:hypothetical protein